MRLVSENCLNGSGHICTLLAEALSEADGVLKQSNAGNSEA